MKFGTQIIPVLSAALIASLPADSWSQKSADSGGFLEGLIFQYQVKDAEILKPLETLRDNYRRKLEKLSENAQTSGNLQLLVATKKEIEGLNAEAYSPAESNFPELKQIQRIFEAEKRKCDKEVQNQRRTLYSEFKVDLKELRDRLTKEGKAEEALALDVVLGKLRDLSKNALIPAPDTWIHLGIPKGAVQFGLNYYRCFDEKLDWESARQKCEKAGGKLVCIESKEEMDFIEKLIGDRSRVWTGGLSDSRGKNWKWLNGEKFDYTNWRPGRPDNKGGDNFMLLFRGPGWEDGPNHLDVGSYLCEWE